MARYEYSLGDAIWHGCRYWKQDDLGPNEVAGWNADYERYEIVRLTPKRIVITIPRSGYPEVYLNRQTMERDGLQYHSRFGEYFFRVKPQIVGDYIGRTTEALNPLTSPSTSLPRVDPPR